MGSYAAVIPRWIKAMIKNEELVIFGDGETSRDFCYVDNVVQANILSAITKNPDAQNKIFNVSVGEQTSLKQLFSLLKKALAQKSIYYERDIIYKDFREGDVKHSLADITRASALMGYSPSHKIEQGLIETIEWYVKYL
jgi:UDP-N-acetylglucosamine 4-epimerase